MTTQIAAVRSGPRFSGNNIQHEVGRDSALVRGLSLLCLKFSMPLSIPFFINYLVVAAIRVTAAQRGPFGPRRNCGAAV